MLDAALAASHGQGSLTEPVAASPVEACGTRCRKLTCASLSASFTCEEITGLGCDCAGCCSNAAPPSPPLVETAASSMHELAHPPPSPSPQPPPLPAVPPPSAPPVPPSPRPEVLVVPPPCTGWGFALEGYVRCPVGQRNAAESECLAAVQAAAAAAGHDDVHVLRTVSDYNIPAGCSYSRFGKTAVFNRLRTGGIRNNRLVCADESVSTLPSIALLGSGDPMYASPESSRWDKLLPAALPSRRASAFNRTIAGLAAYATPSLFVYAAGHRDAWRPFATSARLESASVSDECEGRRFDSQYTNLVCALRLMSRHELERGTAFDFAARLRPDVPVTFVPEWFAPPGDVPADKLLLTLSNQIQAPTAFWTEETCSSPQKATSTIGDHFLLGRTSLMRDLLVHAQPTHEKDERNLFQVLVYLNASYTVVASSEHARKCDMCSKERVRVNATGVYCRSGPASPWNHSCVVDWESDPVMVGARARDVRLLRSDRASWRAPGTRSAATARAHNGLFEIDPHPDERPEDPLPFDLPRGVERSVKPCL